MAVTQFFGMYTFLFSDPFEIENVCHIWQNVTLCTKCRTVLWCHNDIDCISDFGLDGKQVKRKKSE